MSYEAIKGTCGACENFEYAGKNKKGYCRWYKSYYWDDDSCREHYSERGSSGSTGCYLTTACCEYKHLPDNCYELETLRHFRDTVLMENAQGREMVKEYYRIAPDIVKKVNESVRRESILEMVYEEILKVCVYIEGNQNKEAIHTYQNLVEQVKKETTE